VQLAARRWLAALAAALLLAACAGGGGGRADVAADTHARPDGTAAPDAAPRADASAADASGSDDAASDAAAGLDAAPDAGAGPDTGDFPPAQPALIPLDGQFLSPARLDGDPAERWLVVDTGAVRTAVEETLLRDVANGVGVVSLDLGGDAVFPDHAVIAADLSTARAYIGAPLMGLVGQDLFAQLWFGLDYRGARVHVARTAPEGPPPGFAAPPVALPYDLVQGLPVVTVQVGDRDVRLIADTGSGVTLLVASAVPADAVALGVGGYRWHTSYGSDPGTVVRLPALAVAGQAVPDTWAVVIPDEHHLQAVFTAIGLEVDGFLGFPVYRRFFVEVRGAERRYDLWPYDTLDHIPATEWDRVGVELRREPDGAVAVDMVFTPSDAAARGVQPDDVLVALDGAPIDPAATLDDLRRRLRGGPGETRRLGLGRAGAPLTLDVRVDRLLPPELP
jgi:hypothetical protein